MITDHTDHYTLYTIQVDKDVANVLNKVCKGEDNYRSAVTAIFTCQEFNMALAISVQYFSHLKKVKS